MKEKEKMNELICGLTWEQIQAAQQGKPHRQHLPAYSATEHSAQVQSDVDRFKIPVAREVKDALQISLPDSYKLVGNTWIHTH